MGGEKKEREGVGESSEKWTFEMRASFIFFCQLSSVTGTTTERCLVPVSQFLLGLLELIRKMKATTPTMIVTKDLLNTVSWQLCRVRKVHDRQLI